MTRRTSAVRAIGFVLGTLLCAALVLPLAPQSASACDVSYEYKPTVDLKHFGHTRACSTSTSLGGATIVAVLALGALAAGGAMAFKRGAAAVGASSAGPGPAPALIAYLRATGLSFPARTSGPPPGAPPYQPPGPVPGRPAPPYPPHPGYQQPPAAGHPGPVPPQAPPGPWTVPPQAPPPGTAPGSWSPGPPQGPSPQPPPPPPRPGGEGPRPTP
ncbi:hypothetical protein [Actinomadura montaniterrae]|uniref:hypothetical protein n=1 Tax=Actinomadura montaniterrae TaxID=1803903 RepID=UPI00178C6200|nr:hypothetical protein [Actinomadura montaniterrae]